MKFYQVHKKKNLLFLKGILVLARMHKNGLLNSCFLSTVHYELNRECQLSIQMLNLNLF